MDAPCVGLVFADPCRNGHACHHGHYRFEDLPRISRGRPDSYPNPSLARYRVASRGFRCVNYGTGDSLEWFGATHSSRQVRSPRPAVINRERP